MKTHRLTPGDVHLISLDRGDDIVTVITKHATDHGIEAAWFTYLGAVQSASLRYFDQEAGEYRDFTIDRHLEVLSGVGNVSLLDGKPFVHTHAAFADEDGRAFGGHVNVGCPVFALEVRLDQLTGPPPVRVFDETTRLSLWGDAG